MGGFDGTRLSVSLKVILANYQVIPERKVVLDTPGLQCVGGVLLTSLRICSRSGSITSRLSAITLMHGAGIQPEFLGGAKWQEASTLVASESCLSFLER